MAKLIVHNPPTVKLKASGYTGTPTGDIELTENNRTYNVSPFATATTAIPEEEKTVTPSTAKQVVTPDEGLLKKVTVYPTPLEEKTVAPSTEQQTIVPQSPAIGFSQFTVDPVTPSIDPDIQPENIKQGVDILGVQGALKPPTLITKQITENGTYFAVDDNADGYSGVTVDVPDNFTKYLDKTIEEVNSDVSGSLSLSFRNCNLLKTVYLPNVTSMSVDFSSLYLFQGCNNLERINMSSYINIPNFWLQNNSSVKEVIITGAKTIGQDAFYRCINLVLRELPSQVSSIGDSAFIGCIKIPYLDMRNLQQIPTLGSGVFSDTTFPFYFRDQQQLEEFAAATNWSVYADRFQIKGATS